MVDRDKVDALIVRESSSEDGAVVGIYGLPCFVRGKLMSGRCSVGFCIDTSILVLSLPPTLLLSSGADVVTVSSIVDEDALDSVEGIETVRCSFWCDCRRVLGGSSEG